MRERDASFSELGATIVLSSMAKMTIVLSSMAKMRTSSKDVGRRNDADDEHHQGDSEPEGEPLLDDDSSTVAIAVEQERLQIETHAARNDREQHERNDRISGEPGRDGDDLVGNRRHALDQDDPGTPLRIGFAERLDFVAVAIELDQPLADRIIQHGADEVAEQAAEYRGPGAESRVAPGLVRARERHRYQHDIGRHRQE